MRKVLIPTDFSKNAFNALKYASQVFKYEKSEFFIVHAYADEVYEKSALIEHDSVEELKSIVLENSEKELQKVLAELKSYSPNPKHRYQALSVFGSLVDVINDCVSQENMDIVVMGTRGETNNQRKTFGSNTLQVLRYVHCPVLAVPEGYKYHAPKKLLFPSNFMVPYKKRELKMLGEMTSSFRSTIHFLYIDPIKTLSRRQEDNKVFLEGCLKRPKLIFETTIEKDKTVAIKKHIVDKKIDMLVIVNSRHSYMEDMLYQSTVDKISLHIKVPFLVLQNLERP